VPANVDATALHRATDFVIALSRLIDREAGRTVKTLAGSSPAATAERV
jgi:hypothetical protein